MGIKIPDRRSLGGTVTNRKWESLLLVENFQKPKAAKNDPRNHTKRHEKEFLVRLFSWMVSSSTELLLSKLLEEFKLDRQILLRILAEVVD